METIAIPTKPFANYKWRWAVLTPTESLNDPPVFLGVLRVFNQYQHYAPSSTEIMEGLRVVQHETNSMVDLVRTKERNLVRNSGQYWKAMGLIEEAHGKIIVSPFGQLLAEGKISQVEFATTVIKTLEIPNRNIIEDTSDWDRANLTIKPLELILDIIALLTKVHGNGHSYITPFELVKIIIPLAGNKATLPNYVAAIIQYREGKLDLRNWPDCATNSNDKRMAREYLLFLTNYGFCKKIAQGNRNEHERYYLSSISKEEVLELHKLIIPQKDPVKVVRQVRITQIPANIERKRVARNILERPYQDKFRKNILAVFNSRCLFTGVNLENVLIASHIKPVEYNGIDNHSNGLCLRSDIHLLFDSNNLRILPSGNIVLSDAAADKINYYSLPRKIVIPSFINKDYLDWRVKYY